MYYMVLMNFLDQCVIAEHDKHINTYIILSRTYYVYVPYARRNVIDSLVVHSIIYPFLHTKESTVL